MFSLACSCEFYARSDIYSSHTKVEVELLRQGRVLMEWSCDLVPSFFIRKASHRKVGIRTGIWTSQMKQGVRIHEIELTLGTLRLVKIGQGE